LWGQVELLGMLLGMLLGLGFGLHGGVLNLPVEDVIFEWGFLEDMLKIIAGDGFSVPWVDRVGLDIDLDGEAADHCKVGLPRSTPSCRQPCSGPRIRGSSSAAIL
jgi:hypothetical protein